MTIEIASLGDSRIRQGFTIVPNGSVGTNVYIQGGGPMVHVQSLLKGRARFASDLCFALGGVTIAHVVDTQIPALLASRAASFATKIVLILIGTNDATNWTAATQATAKTKLLDGITALRNAGFQVIMLNETARGNAAFPSQRLTTTTLGLMRDYSSWLVSYVGQLAGVRTVDVYRRSADPLSALGDIRSNYTEDGLHPNTSFWHFAAPSIVDALDNWIGPPAANINLAYPSDHWDITNNPRGNVFRNTNGTESVPATVTITNANPAVITATAHGRANNTAVRFSTTGTLPAGLTAGAQYYVLNQATNTFQVSATPAGTAIATSSAGSGTHSAVFGGVLPSGVAGSPTMTGTLPEWYTASVTYGTWSGMTVAMSVVNDASGNPCAQAVITGTASGDLVLRMTPSVQTVTWSGQAGTEWLCLSLGEIDANPVGLKGFTFISALGGPSGGDNSIVEFGSTGIMAADAYTGPGALLFLCESITVPTSTYGLGAAWDLIIGAGTVNLTVRYLLPAARKVLD